jgi:hypothetical protein
MNYELAMRLLRYIEGVEGERKFTVRYQQWQQDYEAAQQELNLRLRGTGPAAPGQNDQMLARR